MDVLVDLLPPLLEGLTVTVLLTGCGAVLAVVVAFVAGLGRLSRHWLPRVVAAAYIEIFRGTSALVQLFWFFFALPMLAGIEIAPMTAGILVLGLNSGSYGAEVVRGAIRAVPGGQLEAAIALNLTRRQRMWRVIVPQAVIGMLPPWGNIFIELLKNSSLVSLITITELTFQGQILRAETLRTTEVFALVLVLYFFLALMITFGMRTLERRFALGLDRGGA